MKKSKSITKYWHGKLIEYDAGLTDEEFLLKYYSALMAERTKKHAALKINQPALMRERLLRL